ncbi:MAG: FecR family protein [Gammaproteobacteria bacterium]
MSRDRQAIAPQIVEQASEWFIRMRERSVSAEDRAAFTDWLRASPLHGGAYLDIARLWVDAGQIDGAFEVEPIGAGPDNVVPLKSGAERPSRSVSRRHLAWAASFLLMLAGGGTYWLVNRMPTYVTEVGEQRVVMLADGSVVRLNSRSRFRVRMSRSLREIELTQGQALFEVAHDTARPFIVRVGDVAVEAVGTQFDVNRKRSGTVVTVVEGRVTVGAGPAAAQNGVAHSEASGARDAVFVSAGEQVTVAATGAMARTSKPNTAAAIGWLQEELVFDGQPLSDVVEEFNRYSRVPIVLDDASLGEQRINGVFHTRHPDALLKFISRIDGVQVERSDEEIRISRNR